MTAAILPDVTAAAQASHRKWGCPASVTCAQWALESAWGAHLSGKNNPFGIKGLPGTPRKTWEVINGQRVDVVQTFRDYASIGEAFDAHGKLLATHPAYELARAHKSDPKAYANALTGHYATDPLYGSKLISIMDAHALYALDVATTTTLDVKPPVARVSPAVVPKPKVVTGTGVILSGAVVVAGAGATAATQGQSYAWIVVLVAAALALATFLVLHFRKA